MRQVFETECECYDELIRGRAECLFGWVFKCFWPAIVHDHTKTFAFLPHGSKRKVEPFSGYEYLSCLSSR